MGYQPTDRVNRQQVHTIVNRIIMKTSLSTPLNKELLDELYDKVSQANTFVTIEMFCRKVEEAYRVAMLRVDRLQRKETLTSFQASDATDIASLMEDIEYLRKAFK